jgi:gamma-glutamylcysteine synthetase
MGHLLGWEPIMEGETIIGLADVTGGGAISLEPGGQFELAGAPLETVQQGRREPVRSVGTAGLMRAAIIALSRGS